jgi:hypothetical protein
MKIRLFNMLQMYKGKLTLNAIIIQKYLESEKLKE